jgi:hypothetical protein
VPKARAILRPGDRDPQQAIEGPGNQGGWTCFGGGDAREDECAGADPGAGIESNGLEE